MTWAEICDDPVLAALPNRIETEFWICDLEGRMTFYDPAGEIPRSQLCPGFPPRITCD